jgi:hypothetical protein
MGKKPEWESRALASPGIGDGPQLWPHCLIPFSFSHTLLLSDSWTLAGHCKVVTCPLILGFKSPTCVPHASGTKFSVF